MSENTEKTTGERGWRVFYTICFVLMLLIGIPILFDPKELLYVRMIVGMGLVLYAFLFFKE